MKDAHLLKLKSLLLDLNEHLRADHGAGRLQLNLFKHSPMKKPQGTIDILHFETEHQSNQTIPAPGIELQGPRVLSVEAEATHAIITRDQRNKIGKLGDIKLTVSIRQKEVFLFAGLDPASNGCAIALIFLMMDGTNLRVLCPQSVRYFSGPVFTSVIDDHDFIIIICLREDAPKSIDPSLHISFLIIGREEYRKTH